MNDLNDIEKKAYRVLKTLLYEEKKSLESIEESVNIIKCMKPFSDYENIEEICDKIKSAYIANIGITNPSAEFLLKNDENENWMDGRDVEECNFERYIDYLRNEDFPEESIEKIIHSTKEILSKCADPEGKNVNNLKKKGLVMGDVQSGKTANYTALINLATDYGYKVVVLLAGMTNSLRAQTQERIDEGFIGAESSSIGNAKIVFVGIGKDEQKYYAIPMTNDKNDFRKDVKKSLNSTASDFNKPLILVVKKNKSVLNQVKEYLKPGQNDITSDNVLIIDDESDNASVNTKDANNPSIINSLIRDLFNNFNIATYIGYTATPFANIFINPYDDEYNRDLFPSDFIVQLHAPSNYFGASKVFSVDENGEYKHICKLDPMEKYFLLNTHKNGDSIFKELPNSLKKAINDFVLTNVIRTLRGKELVHRTMMINISMYNDIQRQIEDKVNGYVDYLKNTIEQTYCLAFKDFIKDPEMQNLYNSFSNDSFYANARTEFSWDQIQKKLNSEIKQFVVTTINNDNKKNRFNYDDYKDSGARVIAIGGYVLSRGLTLHGLMISYYNRSSSMYDTILQMCRWFGYRNGYEDLCRIYMTQESIDNFGDVIDAIEDLKNQFRQMKIQGKKPEDFGLMVKQSPKRLNTQLFISSAIERFQKMNITSQNKMKNTEDKIIRFDYGCSIADTSKLYLSEDANNNNWNAFYDMVNELKQKEMFFSFYQLKNHKERFMIQRVPKNYIATFVSKLKIPEANMTFDIELITDYIKDSKGMPEWDVVVATGDEKVDGLLNESWLFEEKSFPLNVRSFEITPPHENIIRISGSNNRLANPGIFVSGLTIEQEIETDKNFEKRISENPEKSSKKTKTASDYLNISRRPLLVIHPVYLRKTGEKSEYEQKAISVFNNSSRPLLGVALGFPKNDTGETVVYTLNRIKIDEISKSIVNEEGYDPNED